MKLELVTFPVKDVRFSKKTSYNNGILEIDKEELIALVSEDKMLASADLDVTFPNEHTRIVNVADVVEPRIKVSGPGCVFPGILGRVETVGQGRTHRLSGTAVVTSVRYDPTVKTGTGTANFSMIDMWGPCTNWTPFSSTINVVTSLKLVDGVTELDAHNTVQLAEFKVARRLAETTKQEFPEGIETFELREVDPLLPRIIYILTTLSMSNDPRPTVTFYGLPVQESLPVLIHPNEIIDGVLTRDACHGNPIWLSTTWGFQNNPLVFRLLREHGKKLNFIGVLYQRTRFESEHGKHVTAQSTSQLAKLLRADGVVITNSTPSGNNLMDLMWTVQACEKRGVKTVLLTPEGGISPSDPPFPFCVLEANAMVSTGCYIERGELDLLSPTKVIGVERGQHIWFLMGGRSFSPWDKMTGVAPLVFTDGIDWTGIMHNTLEEY